MKDKQSCDWLSVFVCLTTNYLMNLWTELNKTLRVRTFEVHLELIKIWSQTNSVWSPKPSSFVSSPLDGYLYLDLQKSVFKSTLLTNDTMCIPIRLLAAGKDRMWDGDNSPFSAEEQ